MEERVAMLSETIKHLIEDDCVDSVIPVPNVKSDTLARVIEYCKKHVESSESESEALKTWDSEFIDIDQNTLFLLILVRTPLFFKTLFPFILVLFLGLYICNFFCCCIFGFLFGY